MSLYAECPQHHAQRQIHTFEDWPLLAVTALVCFSLTFFSEFTSNTATSNILMPILAATAQARPFRAGVVLLRYRPGSG